MEERLQRRHVQDYDLDDTTVRDLSILLGVVAAAFIGIGVLVYAFGDNDAAMTAANNPQNPPSEMTKAPRAASPASTVGQGGAP